MAKRSQGQLPDLRDDHEFSRFSRRTQGSGRDETHGGARGPGTPHVGDARDEVLAVGPAA